MKKLIIAAVLALLGLGCLGLVLRFRANERAASPPKLEQAPSFRLLVPLRFAEQIYDGKLAAGWEDWGWGPHELPAVPGPAKITFAGYGGILLHHAELRGQYGAFSFRYKTPPEWSDFLSVTLKGAISSGAGFPVVAIETRHIAKAEDGWQEALIPWSELNPNNLPIDGLSLAARSRVGTEPVLLDRVGIVEVDGGAVVQAGPNRDVSLAIQCKGVTHPISPLIYGANGGNWASGATAMRVGGNPMSRLNWDLTDTWNAGNDWFFENVKGNTGLWQWLDDASNQHAQTALTVPMLGWVAKDAISVGFPRAQFPGQRKYDEARAAGDGFMPTGSRVAPGSPTQTSTAAPPEVIARWIKGLRDRDRGRGQRSVLMYLLDNEPSLWNVTHYDVHPEPLTYDELLDRTIRYASVIRDADPDAVIAGPCEWGWTGYFYSGRDRETGTWAHTDRLAHGNTALIPWYLEQLASYQKRTGKRLLDTLDVHFYPAPDGVYGKNARTDVQGSELRLRSTRALWDPGYKDESWIDQSIALIPMLKDWVAKNYPGLKVSIGEWSFGADDHISGALATVEALGRFGQQGLDSAFYWDGPKAGSKTAQGFLAYRNFDGKGGRFQDISVPTREGEKVSLFASRNATGDRIVAIVLNRDSLFTVNATVALDGCGARVSQQSFSYGARSAAITADSSPTGTPSATTISLPPFSFAVLDLAIMPTPN